MAANKTLQRLNRYGFGVAVNKNEVLFTGNMSAIMAYLSEWERPEINAEMDRAYNTSKRRSVMQTGGDRDPEHVGTMQTVPDGLFRGKFDMSLYESAKRELLASGFGRKVTDLNLGETHRRRRFMSEHDGEYAYDRRFDLTPFAATRRESTRDNSIKIVSGFSIHWGISGADIARYAAKLWAAAQILEDNGFTVQIEYYNRCTDSMSGDAGSFNLTNRLEIKGAGNYVNPKTLATIFSPAFFRRVMFSLWPMIADANDCDVASGLGRPVELPPFTYDAKKDCILAEFAMGKLANDKIEGELLKAIAAKSGGQHAVV